MGTRKKIVAGNWKMNMRFDEAVTLVKAVIRDSRKVQGVRKVICPPFPYLKTIRELMTDEEDFFVGAQNCSEHDKGAYTGEVSAAMLRDSGCAYVIVGHSERRAYFRESDEQLTAKIGQALLNQLSVIFCFGEQLSERKAGTHFDVVRRQISAALAGFPTDKLSALVLAYEPVWAIGTGETATPRQAQEMHAFVRTVVKELFGPEAAATTSILYGGSCNASNAAELFGCADVDGGLIGGASLKAEDFSKIIASF
jgi:triosephosphate isomerase (TIM)